MATRNDETLGASPNSDPLVYTVPECARLLRVSKNHVYNLIKQGAIPYQRYGKLIRIPQWALTQHLLAAPAVAIGGDQSVHVTKQDGMED